MNANGTAHKYGDNVDTDVIIPARYLNTSDPKELAEKCMCDIDADFVKKIKVNDIMVAGFNFGCGSSREHAPIAIKASGISCVIAKALRVSFTAMRSTSVCQSWNVWRQVSVLMIRMRWKSTSIPEKS